jgi:hypothetical protein
MAGGWDSGGILPIEAMTRTQILLCRRLAWREPVTKLRAGGNRLVEDGDGNTLRFIGE